MSRRPEPRSVEEALQRAGLHARRAVAEAIASARALLDAASLAFGARSAAERSSLGGIARALDELEASLNGDSSARAPLLGAFADSLDAEIAKWERRARSDPEARSVLRAFLGVRELLWQLGVPADDAAAAKSGRPGTPSSKGSPEPAPTTARPTASKAPQQDGPAAARQPASGRVQRVRVR